MADAPVSTGAGPLPTTTTNTPNDDNSALPEAVIRAYDAKKDQKLVRYLIGAGVMEP